MVRGFIDDAKHTLAIAVQELDSRTIPTSVLAAKARGVRVQIILEGGYLPVCRPGRPSGK